MKLKLEPYKMGDTKYYKVFKETKGLLWGTWWEYVDLIRYEQLEEYIAIQQEGAKYFDIKE